MTLEKPLWGQNSTYTAQADRRLVGALWSAGVTAPDELRVTQRAAGATMSVDVAAGTAIIEGTAAAGQGRYLCHSTATENVPVSAAPASGRSRIDLIVARVRDSAVTGGDDDWVIEAVAGTDTSGVPSEPNPPASSLVLARVAVAGGAANIRTQDITDRRVLAGSRVDHGSLNIRPSFDGQIAVANGRLYLAVLGQWVWANQPAAPIQPNYPQVYSTSTSSWATSSSGQHQLMSVSVPAPGFAATLVMSMQGWSNAHNDPVIGTYWLRSVVGGSTVDHRQQWVASRDPLSPAPVALVASRQVSASQATTVSVWLSGGSPRINGGDGQLVVQVLPR